MIPKSGGAFGVVRFSPGTQEAETWTTSKGGWTISDFNQIPPIEEAMKMFGGMETGKNQYFFEDIQQVAQAIACLGKQFDAPEEFHDRETHLTLAGSTIKVVVKKEKKDDKRPPGWAVSKTGREFVKTLAKPETTASDESWMKYDDEVRAVIADVENMGKWAVSVDTHGWCFGPERIAINRLGLLCDPKEALALRGKLEKHAWKQVCRPFEAEYPGHRQWNRGAPQYSCKPVEGPHPHWDQVLNHCFGSLDRVIFGDPVCRHLGITSGAQYGLYWIASILQTPYQPLPYLFFHGDENSGKSTFCEAFKLLVTSGCVDGTETVKGKDNFNGELAGALLIYIEELNIAKTPGVMDKLKNWITGQEVTVRDLFRGRCTQRNTRHFVQIANPIEYCPVEPGDTRINVIFVPPLGEKEIQTRELNAGLQAEASHFLYTALNTELPMYKRLRLPVIDTIAKKSIQELRRPPVERFIDDQCFHVPGTRIKSSEFTDRFAAWQKSEEGPSLTKGMVSRQLPGDCPQGYAGGHKWIGNLSWENTPAKDSRPWVLMGRELHQ